MALTKIKGSGFSSDALTTMKTTVARGGPLEQLSVSGTVTANAFIGDGSGLTGVTSYTDSDTAAYLVANGYDTATNIVASIVDTAPTTLDTLNELAAALGDDPNFATTITNQIAALPDSDQVRGLFSASGDLSYNSTTGVFSVTVPAGYDTTDFNTDFATKTTSNLSEGTNLYYTTTRANSAIDARVTKSFVDALNVDADTLDGQHGSYYLDYNNFTNTPSPGAAYDTNTTSTGFFDLPAGTTAQRPSSPAAGYTRFNTTIGSVEFYTGATWLSTNSVPTINSIDGNILVGEAGTLTLNMSNSTAVITVVFKVSGSEVARVTDVSTTNDVASVSIPSAVYNQTSGTTINISIENDDGTPSNNSVNKTTSQPPSGGTKTSYDGYVVHTFTSSGTFSTNDYAGQVEYLVVAGGGGGGFRCSRWAGGAGAGGLRSSIAGYNSGGGASAESTYTVSSGQNISVVVGGGGAYQPANCNTYNNGGSDGGISSFGNITSLGGGGGGGGAGRSGASGGGGSNGSGGGSGTAGQGYAGGGSQDQGCGGGGGGAAQTGSVGNAGNGIGFAIYDSNLSYFAGGGVGCGNSPPLGGTGGSSTGAPNSGAGGVGRPNATGTNGGSGIVIVRYQP